MESPFPRRLGSRDLAVSDKPPTCPVKVTVTDEDSKSCIELTFDTPPSAPSTPEPEYYPSPPSPSHHRAAQRTAPTNSGSGVRSSAVSKPSKAHSSQPLPPSNSGDRRRRSDAAATDLDTERVHSSSDRRSIFDHLSQLEGGSSGEQDRSDRDDSDTGKRLERSPSPGEFPNFSRRPTPDLNRARKPRKFADYQRSLERDSIDRDDVKQAERDRGVTSRVADGDAQEDPGDRRQTKRNTVAERGSIDEESKQDYQSDKEKDKKTKKKQHRQRKTSKSRIEKLSANNSSYHRGCSACLIKLATSIDNQSSAKPQPEVQRSFADKSRFQSERKVGLVRVKSGKLKRRSTSQSLHEPLFLKTLQDKEVKEPAVQRQKPVAMTRKFSKKSLSPDRPSWGFGNPRVPSRQDFQYDSNDYGALYERDPVGLEPSRLQSRMDFDEGEGMSYDDVLENTNTLKPTSRLTRQDSKISMSSNVTSRWKEDLQNYQAKKIMLFKNGDQWFDGFELRYRPNKDFRTLDDLLMKISPRIDFTTSVAYLFDTDGNRIKSMEELEDSQSYVASNTKKFFAAHYGKKGEAFWIDGKRFSKFPRRRRSMSSKSASSSSESKPGSADGKVIKIINNDEPAITERVLLNLKTSQTFEDVIKDLGQVLKMRDADKMFSLDGREVNGFSHLRTEFYNDTTFIISKGMIKVNRAISRSNSEPLLKRGLGAKSRSVSRADLRDLDSSGNIKVLIKGIRKTYSTPKLMPPENSNPPESRMILEWIYGYRGADQVKNLWVLENGEMIYFAAAVVIIYNRMDERQRIYTGHTEDVQCLDIHPNGELIATGQRAGTTAETKAHVRIWNHFTLDTVTIIGFGECDNGVRGVSFSSVNRGLYLSLVDESDEHKLAVWEWSKNDLLSKVATNVKKISGISFHPFDNNLIITYGLEHLTFWSRRRDGFIERVDVVEAQKPNVDHRCITFLSSGDLVIGESEGSISVYSVTNEGEYFRSFTFGAHEGGVSSVMVISDETVVSSGEKDGKIIAWDVFRDFEKIIQTELPSAAGSARTICPQWPGRTDGNIYVGTTKNLILEGSLQRKFNLLVFGHTQNLSAIATHPADSAFVTAGYDKVVVKWRRTKLIWKLVVLSECLTCCFHPQGTVIALGTSDGHLIVVNSESGTHVTTIRVCGASLNAVKYSQDGDLLAAGSNNGSIYLYKVSRDGFSYKKHNKITGGQHITHVDWDEEGHHLQSCSADFNQLFWNVDSNRIEKVANLMRDQVWVDQTCPVGWAVSGLWGNHNYSHDYEISAVHVNGDRSLLASGDTDGNCRLFRYPATSPKAEFYEQKVVSGSLSNVKFFFDNSYLLGVGGEEGTIFKWRLV